MTRRYEALETLRKKASMSQKIVSQKDADYALYAGASYDDADKMAKVDVMLEFGLIPEKYVPFVKLYRAFLNQRRKAFFASVGCTEISKLGFLLGIKDERIKATK
jgi:hypothetical protein